jgi:hypothetical protein
LIKNQRRDGFLDNVNLVSGKRNNTKKSQSKSRNSKIYPSNKIKLKELHHSVRGQKERKNKESEV